MSHFKKLILLSFVVLGLGSLQHISVWAKDSFGRPQLEVPVNAARLSIAFGKPELWDGKRIPRTMQCTKNGGEKPTSPQLKIGDIPANTTSLVVYFLNEPPSWDNHGLFRVRRSGEGLESVWTIPSVASQALEKLPKSVELYDGGNGWGKAYGAPCPTGGSWRYTVTVYALDNTDKVLGTGKHELGYAP